MGRGEVKLINAKIKAIFQFPIPKNKKELMRFLGMAGYYRYFFFSYRQATDKSTAQTKRVPMV